MPPPPLTPPSRSSYGSNSSSSSSSTASISARINFKKLLTSFFKRYDHARLSEVEALLQRFEGKEAKLMLMLAKRYDTSNPLNSVYVKYHARLSTDRLEDFTELATLYLSIFRPSDLAEVDTLLDKYKGKEDELFSKLASNFHAINPLKIRKIEQQVDYKQALTAFYEENDAAKVDEVDAILAKSAGKEAILFSVLAEKYQAMNGLDPVMKARLALADQPYDYISLLQLYLAIFHPACTSSAESMLARYGFGKEAELFDALSRKFRSTNPLSICKIGRKSGGSSETETKPASLSQSLPQSPMIASR